MSREHEMSDACWCNPVCRMKDGVVTHGKGCDCYE